MIMLHNETEACFEEKMKLQNVLIVVKDIGRDPDSSTGICSVLSLSSIAIAMRE